MKDSARIHLLQLQFCTFFAIIYSTFIVSGGSIMNSRQTKVPLFQVITLVWYRLMLFAGMVLITAGIYYVFRGDIQAILLLLPGVIALVGGMIIRNGVKKTLI